MENSYLYTYYIGANNETKVVERENLLAYMKGKGIKGCTIRDAVGIWGDTTEQSVAVEIIGGEEQQDNLLEIKEGLRVLLKQEAVLLTKNPIGIAW